MKKFLSAAAAAAVVASVSIVGVASSGSPVAAASAAEATFDHDWNRDGFGDVLGTDSAGRLWLYPSNGRGGFSPRGQLGSGWSGYDQIRPIGDFNGDGVTDLMARKISTGELFLYPGNGSGRFQPRQRIGTGWGSFSHIFSPGDWTGDGINDLLATRKSDGRLLLYRGRGDGGVFSGVQAGTGWQTILSVIPTGDFNGNGVIDFLGRDTQGRLRLFNGNGSGGFASVQIIGAGFGGFTSTVGVGDFSGDGRSDLLGRNRAGQMVLFRGTGGGGWTSPYPVIATGWGGIRFPDATPTPLTPSAIYGRFCTSGAPIRSVLTTDKVVAFTFDDGPWPTNTQAVMSTFERYGWRANFFMIGVNVIRYGDIARSVVRRGHGIAAHSMTHRYGVSTIASEVSASANIIQSTTGVRPTFFRAPGLTQSSSIDRAVYSSGMCNISTASDLGDWRSPRASSSTLCSRFNNALRPGAIILLHDGGSHSQTVNAVSCMLESVKRNGYRVVDLGALLSGKY